MFENYKLKLQHWKEKNLNRQWQTHENFRHNFSSNDYLGLSQDSRLIKASMDATQTFGCGSQSSRAVSGTLPLHVEIENSLASFCKKEEAILFNSGYQANSTILQTFGDEKTLLILDHHCHRSLIEGAYQSQAFVKRFRHNDANHLESILKKYRDSYETCWIVTESLFSMDGDLAPLESILDLKRRYEAFLFVDEAHSLGVLGPQGSGLANEADLIVGTFGKAFGSFGAFAAGNPLLIEYLRQFCPGLTYTTALPPCVLGSIREALKIIPSMEKERSHLKSLASAFNSPTHIVPFHVEDPMALSNLLKSESILVHAIRPPTVQKAMIRIVLRASHTTSDILTLKSLIQKNGQST